MAQAHYRYTNDIAELKPREFGLTAQMAMSFAFLLIQLNLALRLPIVATNIPLFAEQMHSGNAFADSAASSLAAFGSTFFDGPFGARIGFALLNFLTAIAAARIAHFLYPKSLAPALTLVWLNTSLIFGLASFLERSEAITAFLVTAGALSLCKIIEEKKQSWWLPVIACFFTAITFDHSLIVMVPFFVVAPLTFRKLRVWYVQPGYWATTLALVAAGALSSLQFGAWSVLDNTSSDIVALSLLPRDVMIASIFISLAIAVGAFVGMKDAWARFRHIETVRILILLIAPLIVLCLLNNANVTLLFPAFPVMMAIAPGALLLSRQFFSKWLIEAITPLAFGTYLFMMGLLIFPASELTSKLPVLDQIFGWDSVAEELNVHAERYHSVWIATDTDLQTLALSAHLPEKTVFPVHSNNAPPEFCHKGGLFLSQATNPNPVMLHFKKYQRIGSIMRRVERRAISTFEVFHVVGPRNQQACQAAQ